MAVQGDNDWLSEPLHIADMTVQVLQTLCQSCSIRLFDVFQIDTAVHLQSLGGGNNHHQPWL